MKLKELELGNILKLRNGALCCIYPSQKRCINGEARLINILNGDLENVLNDLEDNLNDVCDSDLDIVKVYKDYTLKNVLWERKEINLTDAERVILSNINKELIYIARDKCGNLFAYGRKPYKHVISWQTDIGEAAQLPFNHLFNFIKWEDEDPYLISDLLKEEQEQWKFMNID